VNEILLVHTISYEIHQDLICSHIIELIKKGSKLWQKSTTKCLIVTFGRACYEVNIIHKVKIYSSSAWFGSCNEGNNHQNFIKKGRFIGYLGKKQELEKILRDLAH